MIETIRKHPVAAAIAGFAAGALLVMGAWAVAAAVGGPSDREPSSATITDDGTIPLPSTSPTPDPSQAPAQADVLCDSASTTVSDASGLAAALAAVQPGDTIELQPGTYSGNFVATTSGTPTKPITLCGSQQSILDGGGTGKGYVFHLNGASHWRLIGFTVTNGQKGVMADTTVGTVISGLSLHHTGDEAVHLRNFSTDNVVTGNRISDTGLRKPKFGEGVYIGTAESNWCDITNCAPDASDRNLVEGNTISGTTSEAIDLKEGTSGGVVRGNSFDGSSITGADSWVDVKGNDYLIESNTGVNSPGDGFQTHEIIDGWGTRNVFRNNTATVNGPGFGFSLTPVRDNVVECSNTASSAGEGLSNVSCSTG